MEFKQKKEPVERIICGLGLDFTDEDGELLHKLINSYFRKKKKFVNSQIENIAGGLLWVYSRVNFLFQYDDEWSQKSIAEKIGIEPKTVSRTSSSIMDAMNIDVFDSRFARKEVAEKDPRNNFFMTKSGFILHTDNINQILVQQMREDPENINASDELENPKVKQKPVAEKKTIIEEDSKNKKLNEFFR